MLPRRSARNSADGFGTSARPAFGHLEHADLVGGAEAVLHGAQDAELVAAVAFEIEHGVDHVLEHAGPGDGAFLGDVPDQHEREAARLGEPDQLEAGGADLADAAGRALDGVEPHGLDGVDDDEAEIFLRLERGGDIAHVDGGGKLHRRVGEAEPAGAEADLVDGFFAGHVAHALAMAGERGGGLQHEGGFTDAGIPADEHDGGRHEAAAEDAIEFGDSHDFARWRCGAAFEADEVDPFAAGLWRRATGPGFDGLFDERVPLVAGLAASGPFRVVGAAVLADVAGDGFSHGGAFGSELRRESPPSVV